MTKAQNSTRCAGGKTRHDETALLSMLDDIRIGTSLFGFEEREVEHVRDGFAFDIDDAEVDGLEE